jgi:hypothetical protein
LPTATTNAGDPYGSPAFGVAALAEAGSTREPGRPHPAVSVRADHVRRVVPCGHITAAGPDASSLVRIDTSTAPGRTAAAQVLLVEV